MLQWVNNQLKYMYCKTKLCSIYLSLQVSFTAVETGNPVHVPDVHKHGRVFFFTSSHSNKEEVYM